MPLRLGIHGCLATTWGRLTWPTCSSRVRKWVWRRSTSLWTTGRSIQVDKRELRILNISDCRAGLPYQYKHRATLVWTSKFRPRNDIDKTVPESVHVNNWCVDISILFLLHLCGVVIKPLVVWLSSIKVQNWRAAQGNLSKGYVGDQVSGLATAIVLLCTPSP